MILELPANVVDFLDKAIEEDKKKFFSEEEDELLKKYYEQVGPVKCIEAFKLMGFIKSKDQVYKRANKLDLHYSHKHKVR